MSTRNENCAHGDPVNRALRGFTLIELLVVVAIISLLVSILLPSLQKAKSLARSTACASNLHQIGLYNAMYQQDYNGSFPIPWYYDINERLPHNWLTDLCLLYGFDNERPALLSTLMADRTIARCPERQLSYDEYLNMNASFGDYWILYGINYSYLSTSSSANPFITQIPINVDAVSSPAGTIFAADSTAETGHCQVISFNWVNGFPSDRHYGGSNVLWCDGHVVWEDQADLIGEENSEKWIP